MRKVDMVQRVSRKLSRFVDMKCCSILRHACLFTRFSTILTHTFFYVYGRINTHSYLWTNVKRHEMTGNIRKY